MTQSPAPAGALMQQKIIRIDYRQELAIESQRPGWSERYEVSVAFFADALTSGWLSRFVGRHGSDLAVFVSITLHAHPLRGSELKSLMDLNLATAQDEGRLCASVSDTALADELQTRRANIIEATQRLAASRLLRIIDLRPADARTEARHPLQDASGKYLKSKLYVLTGELGIYTKTVQSNSAAIDGVRFPYTAPDGVRKPDTAETETAYGFPPDGERKPYTNIKSFKGGGGGDTSAPQENVDFEDQEIWAYFNAKRGRPHVYSEKEVRALTALRAAGYSQTEIQDGIDRAFARPAKPQNFSLCAAMVRDQPPASMVSEARTKPEPRQPEAASQEPQARLGLPPARPAAAGTQPETGKAALVIPPELEGAVKLLSEAGETLTSAKLARLARMAEAYQAAAAKHGTTAMGWIEKAMTQGLGEAKSSLIGYADTILRRWAKFGPDQEPVSPGAERSPARSAGATRKPASRKTTAADRIARTEEALSNYRRSDGH